MVPVGLSGLTLSGGHCRNPAAVRRAAADPTVCDDGRTLDVLKEAGVRLTLFQHRESRDRQEDLRTKTCSMILTWLLVIVQKQRTYRLALLPADVGWV